MTVFLYLRLCASLILIQVLFLQYVCVRVHIAVLIGCCNISCSAVCVADKFVHAHQQFSL